MFEALISLANTAGSAGTITYSISTDIPVALKGLSDAYFADNKANSAATHGGMATGGTYTGQAFSYAVDTGTILQPYNAGSANAFGAGIYFKGTNAVIYTGAIWANGPQSSASYTHGCWYRPFTGAGAWGTATDTWPLVDGKIWRGMAAAASDTAMYFFGGFNHVGGFFVTNAVYKLTGTGTWYEVSQPTRMPYAAQGVGAVYHEGYYYIYGGTQGAGRLKFMYRMKESDHTFERLADLPLGTTGSQGIVVNGHIVFLSRMNENDNCVIIAYHIASNTYKTLEIPHTYRSGYTALNFGGKAKFVGGAAGYWSRPFGAGNANSEKEYNAYIGVYRFDNAVVVDVS